MTDSHSIELAVQLNQKDIYRANVAIIWGRHKIYEWVGIAACAAAIGGFLFAVISSPTNGMPSVWLGSVFGIMFAPVFLYAMVYVGSYSSARSILRNTPALQGSTVWAFTENGISVVGPTARGELQWNSFLRVRETREQFLLYQNKNLANVIPKRSFATHTEISRLREMIRRQVPTALLRPDE
jgi:hypothetical protein